MPIGDYTLTVLENMGATDVLDNVVSEEEDVKGVVGKVTSGAADAGFVYVTDANAAGDAVQAIELPEEAQAVVEYPIAVVVASEKPGRSTGRSSTSSAARTGKQALADAGFGPP